MLKDGKSLRWKLPGKFVLLISSLALGACGINSTLNLQEAADLRALEVRRVLADNRLKEDENLKIVNLGRLDGMSQHLVQIRMKEAPHFHKNHDLIVFMLRAKGHLMLDGKRIDVQTNDILTIR